MKTSSLKSISILLVLFFISGITEAQVVKTRNKEYKRAVKQRTRELTKKGYAAKGAATVQIYIKSAINKEFETDDKGETKNAVVYTSAVDPTFEGAVNACRAAARAALAGNIETNVAELVKRSLATEQVSMKSADGINKTITAGKQLIAQKVSMEDIYTLYRDVKDERDGKSLIEVEYASTYSKKLAMQKAGEFVREQLKNEAEDLHKDLDKIFKLE
jgi:hypothetical protein